MNKPEKRQSQPTLWVMVNGRLVEGRVKRTGSGTVEFRRGRRVTVAGMGYGSLS